MRRCMLDAQLAESLECCKPAPHALQVHACTTATFVVPPKAVLNSRDGVLSLLCHIHKFLPLHVEAVPLQEESHAGRGALRILLLGRTLVDLQPLAEPVLVRTAFIPALGIRALPRHAGRLWDAKISVDGDFEHPLDHVWDESSKVRCAKIQRWAQIDLEMAQT